MLVKINGLPAHVLLVHVVVVMLPLAALMLVLGVLWPRARHKFGFLTPLAALIGLVLVPITTHAGEWLEARLPESKAIKHHADLGDQLLPWAFGLFVMSAAVWWVGRRRELAWRAPSARQPDDTPTGTSAPASGGTATLTRPAPSASLEVAPLWLTAALTVLSVVVAVGVSIMLYRIGDSGAHAAWNGVANLPAR